MNEIRLLALDVDGTLAWRADEILPETRRALHALHDTGVEVVIATGRRYRTTRRAIEALGLDVAAVSLGGALVKERDGATLARQSFSSDALGRVVGRLKSHGLSPIGQRDGHAEGGADFVIDGGLPWNGWTSRYMEANQRFAEWSRDLAEAAREDVLVVGAFADRAPLAAVEAALHEAHPGAFQSVITPLPKDASSGGGHYLEVALSRVDKWSGLAPLVAERGLDASVVCTVGDQVNDLAMLRAAGVGVAMGNAPPEVQEAADWVTRPADENGIVDVVERILG